MRANRPGLARGASSRPTPHRASASSPRDHRMRDAAGPSRHGWPDRAPKPRARCTSSRGAQKALGRTLPARDVNEALLFLRSRSPSPVDQRLKLGPIAFKDANLSVGENPLRAPHEERRHRLDSSMRPAGKGAAARSNAQETRQHSPSSDPNVRRARLLKEAREKRRLQRSADLFTGGAPNRQALAQDALNLRTEAR